MARIKTNEDIPAPPRGSRSMRGHPSLRSIRGYANFPTDSQSTYKQKMIDIRAADKVEYQRRVANIKTKAATMRKVDKENMKKYNQPSKGTKTNNAKAQNPGRAQPKGTQPKTLNPKNYRAGGNNPQSVLKNLQLQNRIGAPSMPARSGPSAGGSGGGSSMYNRLTGGGLRSHGR